MTPLLFFLPYSVIRPAVSGGGKEEGKVELNFGELADKCRRRACARRTIRKDREKD